MSREDDIRLIARSHRVSEAEAEKIIDDIESGRKTVISAEALARKAGVSRSDLRKSTRPIARLFGESLESLDLPPRNAGRRDNGRHPSVGNASARGLG